MTSALSKSIARLAAMTCVAVLGGLPLLGAADQPSYAQNGPQDETITGTIYQVTSRYTLTLQDDRGFIDNVTIHNGTVITPTGLGLGSGQVATLTGHTSGKFFDADEVDVDPSSIASGQSLLPGGDYTTALSGAGYPAYAFGYDTNYFGAYGNGYYGQAYSSSGGYYAPTGYYPGYGSAYPGGHYVPPYNNGGQNGTTPLDPLPRRPVRLPVGSNPPPGYRYPTGGNRVAPPSYRSAPVMRGNPAPAAPRSAPAAAPATRSR